MGFGKKLIQGKLDMKLSDLVPVDSVFIDGEFSTLGLHDRNCKSLMTFACNDYYLRLAISNRHLTSIVTTLQLAAQVPQGLGIAISENPRDLLYEIHEKLFQQQELPTGSLGSDCRIHPTAVINPGAVIGNGVKIEEFAVIRSNVHISDDVIIGAGSKLGVDGILYRGRGKNRRLIPHAGSVEIGCGSAILYNSVVMSAVFQGEATQVGEGCVIGSNSIIGHNAQIYEDSVVSNNCVIARGSKVGPAAFLGTGSVIREFTSFGAESRAQAGSIVVRNVEAGETVSGNFAKSHSARMRSESPFKISSRP
jgi:UDP-3-O-[3-hydroxymyristoyl] glucosamine N-acyltransferase